MTGLEARYRRLLAFYPREHRQLYEDEMLGVLLAAARPGQRWPSPAEVADIFASAGRVRWLHRSGLAPDDDWRRAAHAVRVFGAILLLALGLRRVLPCVATLLGSRSSLPFSIVVGYGEVLRPVLWAAVLVAALAGRRWLVVPLALGALTAEVVQSTRFYTDTPATLLDVWWIILAAFAVLVATMVSLPAGASTLRPTAGASLAGPPAGASILGPPEPPSTGGSGAPRGTGLIAEAGAPRGTRLITAAGVAIVGSGFAVFHGTVSVLWAGQRRLSVLELASLGIAGLLIVLGARRLGPAVARRLAAWAAAVASAVPLVRFGFAGFIAHNQRMVTHADLLRPGQWVLLIAIPAATFLTVAALNRQFERSGRAAEQRRVAQPG